MSCEKSNNVAPVPNGVQSGGEPSDEAKLKLEVEKQELRSWTIAKLSCDDDIRVGDTVNALCSELAALKERPLLAIGMSLDSICDDGTTYLNTAAFRPLCHEENMQGYHYTVISHILFFVRRARHNGHNMLWVIRELELALRLFVALGGDLNMPMCVLSDSGTPVTISEASGRLRDRGSVHVLLAPASTTLAAWLVHESNEFLYAVLIAGPRLCIQWDVMYITRSFYIDWFWSCAPMFQDASMNLENAMRDVFGEDASDRADVKRLIALVGERGVCYSAMVRGSDDPIYVKLRDLPNAVSNAVYRAFEDNDASPYRLPGTDTDETRINARRNKYRSGLKLNVQRATQLLLDLCVVIESYVMAPLLPPSSFIIPSPCPDVTVK